MRSFIVLAIASVVLLSCKKDKTIAPGLFGKWEARRIYNNPATPHDSTYAAGNGNIVQLNSDSSYKRFTKGNLTDQGVFHTKRNGAKVGSVFYNTITFSVDTTFKSAITLQHDTLTLKPLSAGFPTTDYRKIAN